MSHDPTTRELKIELKGLGDKLEDHNRNVMQTLEEIKMQTTKTNGRVSTLENWKWMITGGVAAISAMLVPILLYIVTHLLNV